MLNIEKGRGNKPIRMDLNIILNVGIRVGAISPYQRSVRVNHRRMMYANHLKTVRNIKINDQVNKRGENKGIKQKTT